MTSSHCRTNGGIWRQRSNPNFAIAPTQRPSESRGCLEVSIRSVTDKPNNDRVGYTTIIMSYRMHVNTDVKIHIYIYIIYIYIYPIVYTLMQSHGKLTMVYQYMCLGTVIYIYIHTVLQYIKLYYINLSGYLHVIDKPPCLRRWLSGPAPRLVEFDRLCRDQRHGPRCKGRLHHGGDESHAMNG